MEEQMDVWVGGKKEERKKGKKGGRGGKKIILYMLLDFKNVLLNVYKF